MNEAQDIAIGLRLRAQRRELKLSQTAVALSVGVSFQQIQKYESGRNRISASTLWRLAQRLEVPVGWFFEDGSCVGNAEQAVVASVEYPKSRMP